MHRVSWDVKRVFLGLAKVRRHLMLRWGLTPDRFDMIYAIRCQRQYWFRQRRLRELLGVCASTISRMIDSLIEIGFLVKRRVPTDKRCCELRITKHGKRTLRCMFGNLIKSGLARQVVGHALADDPDSAPTNDAKIARAVDDFEMTMAYFKLNLEDTACFDYGLGGEYAKPPPAELGYLTPAEKLIWLGDEEPLMQWLARV
jgi:DNA-binding MarR family transcriptional regulator